MTTDTRANRPPQRRGWGPGALPLAPVGWRPSCPRAHHTQPSSPHSRSARPHLPAHCTRSHTCAQVHAHTHSWLCTCFSRHRVCPLPAPASKVLALAKEAEHTLPRGPEAARTACLLLTSFLPQTGLETGAPGHSSDLGASVPPPRHHEGSKDFSPFLRSGGGEGSSGQ